ncbi:MAG TPA: hypothetical protein VFA94_09925, partial [Acidimicrobiales bacterium]|nr:hypothetical protein [Acidimicrobiales bacterium]
MTALQVSLRRWVPPDVRLVGLAVAGALLGGVVAVKIGSLAGPAAPLVIVLLAAAPALAVAVFARPQLGIALIFLAIPIGSHAVPKLPMQIVQVLIVVVAAIVAVRRIGSRAGVLGWQSALWWFLFLVVWAVIGLPSSANAATGVRQTLLLLWAVMLAASVVGACRTREHVRLALAALLVVAVGIAATTPLGVGHVQTQFGASVISSGRAQSVFYQPNELGTFAAVAFLVAVGMALGGRTQRSRRVASAVVLVVFLPLVASLSRGAWIGVALG